MKKNRILLAASLAAFLVGCDDNPPNELPEVSAENCTLDRIQKIEDRTTREQFAGACSRRPVIAPTENPKNWLEVKP